jgi:hypothetical protein
MENRVNSGWARLSLLSVTCLIPDSRHTKSLFSQFPFSEHLHVRRCHNEIDISPMLTRLSDGALVLGEDKGNRTNANVCIRTGACRKQNGIQMNNLSVNERARVLCLPPVPLPVEQTMHVSTPLGKPIPSRNPLPPIVHLRCQLHVVAENERHSKLALKTRIQYCEPGI